MSDRKKPFDLIRRGEKKPTISGTVTFIGLRLADLPLQHALLSPPSSSGLGVHILSSLGLRTIFTPTTTNSIATSSLLPISAFVGPSNWLTNLTPTAALLLLMSAGSTAKQIYWHLALSQDSFPASAALAVSVYNTLVNSGNALLFLALGTTSLLSRPHLSLPSRTTGSFVIPLSTVVGTVLYVAGIAIETVSERQRAQFKSRPQNKGKVCKVGLWGWARHINYFGYTLWRAGYCMVGSGWLGGLVMALFQGWDLSQRAVAVQDEYCSGRYGEQWVRFKQEVPYRFIPGVY